jgi:hypothetical protein
VLTFAWLALAPQARAGCEDGCDTIHRNTFQGDDALINNTTGVANTAIGSLALSSNTEGYANTAFGESALENNTTGYENTAIGAGALRDNTLTFENTAIGVNALADNTTGALNTVTGANAGGGNSNLNTVDGAHALSSNTVGGHNTVVGAFSLHFNTTGSHNIALGDNAGGNLTTGDNNIDIGNDGVAGESDTIRIGTQGTQTRTFIAGIRGTPITGAVAVGVNSSGQLGVRPSSARFKEAIKPIGRASEAILALKPITFRYNKDLDAKGVPQFGLVAEEVAKVNPDLVVADDQGKPFTVRYEEVNAMLLNEFLKEHRKVQELKANSERQQKQIEGLTAGLQKVSAQLEVNKLAAQTVVNNQQK